MIEQGDIHLETIRGDRYTLGIVAHVETGESQ
jgi:hypothetical protein